MAEKRVSVRLVAEGGGAFRAELEGIGETGDRALKRADASAQVFAQEMDRLRLKFDPVYASSMRFSSQVDELNRAQSMGITITGGYEAALERLNAEFALQRSATMVGAANLGMMSQATGGLAATLNRSAPMIQQASYQVQDFAVQVAMGTSVSRAFSQQAPQLLGSLGAVGSRFGLIASILGVVIAVGVPLVAMLMGTTEEVKSLGDQLDDLDAGVRAYVTSSRDAGVSTAELTEQYGSATIAAREFLAAQIEISRVEALEGLRSALREVATQFGTFEASVGDAENVGSPLEETFARVRSELRVLHTDEVPQLVAALRRLNDAATPEAAVEAATRLLAQLEQTLGPYEDMNTAARELYENVSTAGRRAAELKGAAEDAGGALSSAAQQAQRIADELDRAVRASSDLAMASVDNLVRAQIEYSFRDDPIRRARELAAAEFDARTLSDGQQPDGAVRQMQTEREQYIANAEALARLNEQTRTWRDAQRDAARAGGRATRAEEEFARHMAEQIESAQMQLDLLGRTSSEVAALTAEQDLLSEARRRNLDLDALQTASGETLREEIEAQAETIGRLTLEYERANERAQFFDGIQGDLKDGLLDSIVAGDDFSATLDNVAQALQRAALQALLFGEGLFANLFGGGGKGGGGILNTIFGSLFHGGGTAGDATPARSLPVDVWASAKRMHGGGDVGLRHDEVPAILQTGERVLSRDQVARGEDRGVSRIEVSLSPELIGSILEEAGNQSVSVMTAGVQSYDRSLPGRVKQIQRNPRDT